MTGHHDVRIFKLPDKHHTLALPDGWKPFAVVETLYGHEVVARKWVRDPDS